MPKVHSMAIVSIVYDRKSRILTVEIRNRNMTVSTYEYQDVPEKVYSDFLNAESHGSFYNKYIRFGYKYSQKG